MSKPLFSIFFATVTTLLLPLPFYQAHAAAQPTCEDCSKETANLAKQGALQKSQQDLLERNRTYLAAIKSEDLSKAVKVRSNILILTVRIETTKNNIESSRLLLSSKSCSACPRPKP